MEKAAIESRFRKEEVLEGLSCYGFYAYEDDGSYADEGDVGFDSSDDEDDSELSSSAECMSE
eukprot:2468229-Amphidinium_carterae.1